MSLIKVTKANGQSTIVPASQRSIYEAMNAKAKKMKKPEDALTIEDYDGEAPAEKATDKKEAKTPAEKATDKK